MRWRSPLRCVAFAVVFWTAVQAQRVPGAAKHGTVPPDPVNGKLQIHFMNVGQGDGAILISPEGETVLFDNGVRHHCDATWLRRKSCRPSNEESTDPEAPTKRPGRDG